MKPLRFLYYYRHTGKNSISKIWQCPWGIFLLLMAEHLLQSLEKGMRARPGSYGCFPARETGRPAGKNP